VVASDDGNGDIGADTTSALRALDRDGSGTVSWGEVKAFAEGQGLESDDILNEFSDLDTNKDGELDTEELAATLDADQQQEQLEVAVPVAPPTQPQLAAKPAPLLAAPLVKPAPILPPPAAAAVAAPPQPPTLPAAPVAAAAPPTIAEAPPAQQLQQQEASDDAESDASTDSDPAPKQPGDEELLEKTAEEVQTAANRIIASEVTHMITNLLSRTKRDRQQAVALEAEAKHLRGQVADLVRKVPEGVHQAVADSVQAPIQKAIAEVKRLQETASAHEANAQVMHQAAQKAMQDAMAAEASLAEEENSERMQ